MLKDQRVPPPKLDNDVYNKLAQLVGVQSCESLPCGVARVAGRRALRPRRRPGLDGAPLHLGTEIGCELLHQLLGQLGQLAAAGRTNVVLKAFRVRAAQISAG